MVTESMNTADGAQYRISTLDSGVRVLSETIPSVRSISVGAFVPTGSRDEDAATSGISHFIEHMVFKGTRRRKLHHISRRMESVGGYLNAYTSKEYTCFFARSLDEHLPRAIDILGDLILEPVFPEKELEKEKGVVIEEIRMYEDVPEDAVFDIFERLLYKDHALGRPILGSESTVNAFTRDGLANRITTHYWTSGLIFAACGNVDHQALVSLVESAFPADVVLGGKSPRKAVNGYSPGSESVGKPVQQAHLVLGTRALAASDERRTALALLNTVLGSGMSSRLNQNIRERYGYCYNIYSFVNFLSDAGEFGIYAGTEPGRLARLEKLIFRELDKLVQTPVGDRTLSQAKNQLKGGLMLGLEDLSARMIRLARTELYYNRYFSLDESLAAIDEVTPTEIRDLADVLFEPSSFSRATIIPQQKQ